MYNKFLVGERIRTRRKAKGYRSQQALADALKQRYVELHPDIDPKLASKKFNMRTVQYWEHGDVIPNLDSLICVSDLLDIDLDYLIGRIDEPTHAIEFIKDQTGLSSDAIAILQKRKETETPSILSGIICHRLFIILMRTISRLYDWKTFNRMFTDSVIHHLSEDGIYVDSPDDFRAIYENQTTTIFSDIVREIAKEGGKDNETSKR